jgi:hypothetical protein
MKRFEIVDDEIPPEEVPMTYSEPLENGLTAASCLTDSRFVIHLLIAAKPYIFSG